jgi:hypothetical protein
MPLAEQAKGQRPTPEPHDVTTRSRKEKARATERTYTPSDEKGATQ